MKNIIVALGALAALAACSSAADPSPGVPPPIESPDAGVSADQAEIVTGVADRDRDPAVIALGIGDTALCTGTLIASNVVLTARHCVASTVEQIVCPATSPQVGADREPSSLHVILGDDALVGEIAARGRAIVSPQGWALCDNDIALVVLDRAVPGITPLAVRRSGVATGDHVRAVGFGRSSDDGPAGAKLLRDHVLVTETTPNEFVVGEATCQGDSGGPALDETTGEIVGVVSRGGPTCDGPGTHNVYTRTDVFLSLIDEALHEASSSGGGDEGAGGAGEEPDSGVRSVVDAGKEKDAGTKAPVTDMGGTCTQGGDCSTGVCVRSDGEEYCSRTCGTGDRCPAHYGCQEATNGTMVCVAK